MEYSKYCFKSPRTATTVGKQNITGMSSLRHSMSMKNHGMIPFRCGSVKPWNDTTFLDIYTIFLGCERGDRATRLAKRLSFQEKEGIVILPIIDKVLVRSTACLLQGEKGRTETRPVLSWLVRLQINIYE